MLSSTQRKFRQKAIMGTLWFGIILYLLFPYIHVIILALLTTSMVYPLYTRIRSRFRWGSLGLTWLAILCILLVPSYILVSAFVSELMTLISDVESLVAQNEHGLSLTRALTQANQRIAHISFVDYRLDIDSIQQQLLTAAKTVSTHISGIVVTSSSSVLSFFTNIIIYIFVVSGMLLWFPTLIHYLKDVSEMKNDVFDLYLHKMTGMGTAMIRATLIIALVQTIITWLSLWAVGVPYIWLWIVLTFVISVIPLLGSAIVVIPISLVYLLTGNIVWWLILLWVNQLFTSTIDNFLRPYLVPRDAKINETLLMLSVFGGITHFGILGIIYGPVLMTFVLVIFDLYFIDHPELRLRKKGHTHKKKTDT